MDVPQIIASRFDCSIPVSPMNAEHIDPFDEDSEATSVYAWMLTFSDLLLLLLTLFILKLSMSSLDGATLHRALSSFILNKPAAHERPIGERASNELSLQSLTLSPRIQALLTATEEAIASIDGQVQGKRESGGRIVFDPSFEILPESDALLLRWYRPFPDNGTELSFRAEQQLRAVIRGTDKVKSSFAISTHSTHFTKMPREFTSAWELTAAQALRISRQFIDAGVEQQSISLFGYGDSRPLTRPAEDAEGLRNARLEIRVTQLGN
jgi:chemotaxis protein MotB